MGWRDRRSNGRPTRENRLGPEQCPWVVERNCLVSGWGSSCDITDPKVAEAALQASQERLTPALGAASGVHDVDSRRYDLLRPQLATPCSVTC